MTAVRLLVPLLSAALAGAFVARCAVLLGPPLPRVAALADHGPAAGGEARPPRPAGRSPPTPRRAVVPVSAGAAVAVSLGGLPAVVLVVAGVVAVPRVQRWRARRRREEALAADLPEVVDLLVVAVGAGLTVRDAVAAVARRAVGPLAAELADVVADAQAGRPLADALDDLPVRAGEPTRPLAAALAGCVRYGTPLVPTLVALAAEARDAERRHLEQRARRLPVLLLFPLVLCILPAFALLTVAPLLADALRALRL
ncbi:MAG TPA: type II secretion system F family protein [Acidimicrobiales bacterium]|nr:type II secretion system F family protein [Acidimicrobiales bacterium]